MLKVAERYSLQDLEMNMAKIAYNICKHVFINVLYPENKNYCILITLE